MNRSVANLRCSVQRKRPCSKRWNRGLKITTEVVLSFLLLRCEKGLELFIRGRERLGACALERHMRAASAELRIVVLVEPRATDLTRAMHDFQTAAVPHLLTHRTLPPRSVNLARRQGRQTSAKRSVIVVHANLQFCVSCEKE